jgi:hypothetical protein
MRAHQGIHDVGKNFFHLLGGVQCPSFPHIFSVCVGKAQRHRIAQNARKGFGVHGFSRIEDDLVHSHNGIAHLLPVRDHVIGQVFL